jgi:hypothetical protein
MFDNSELSLAEKTVMLMTDILKWRDGIETALHHGANSHTFDDVVARILAGELQFYDFGDCCVIMQLVFFPQFKNYHCFAAAGTQEALDAVQEHMLNMSKHLGCKHLTISGRAGWERRLKARGWKQASVTMYMEVPQ